MRGGASSRLLHSSRGSQAVPVSQCSYRCFLFLVVCFFFFFFSSVFRVLVFSFFCISYVSAPFRTSSLVLLGWALLPYCCVSSLSFAGETVVYPSTYQGTGVLPRGINTRVAGCSLEYKYPGTVKEHTVGVQGFLPLGG